VIDSFKTLYSTQVDVHHDVYAMLQLLRFALSNFAPVRLQPVRSAPIRFAPAQAASLRFAPA